MSNESESDAARIQRELRELYAEFIRNGDPDGKLLARERILLPRAPDRNWNPDA